jgi:hypothetical protein
MRRLMGSLLALAALLLMGTLAGCGIGSGTGPLSSLSPTRSLPSRTSQPSAAPSPSASAPTSAEVTTPVPTSAPVRTPVTAPQSGVSSPAPASGSGSAIWLWVLLAAVVLAGVITWIALAARRRNSASAASADRKSRVVDAYAQGAALYDAMSVAETPGALVAPDAGARWSDIQRRADDLTQALYALRAGAANEEERSKVADVLVSLQAVRSAMDAERAPMGAGEQQAEVVRGRLASFESALRALQAPYDPAQASRS